MKTKMKEKLRVLDQPRKQKLLQALKEYAKTRAKTKSVGKENPTNKGETPV